MMPSPTQQDTNGDLPNERWLPVVDYEGLYEVSSAGRVRGLARLEHVVGSTRRPRTYPKRMLRQHIHPERGYPAVHLNKTGKKKTIDVHKLVCCAFHGPRPPGMEVRHLNDIKTDNSIENLSWGSKHQNSLDAVRNGTHPMAKKTHCKRGHEFTSQNTYVRTSKGKSRRTCRTCKGIEQAARLRRNRQLRLVKRAA